MRACEHARSSSNHRRRATRKTLHARQPKPPPTLTLTLTLPPRLLAPRDPLHSPRRAEFGAVVYGSASRALALLSHVAAAYPPSRVGLVYGEDIPAPLGAGLPLEGIQRPVGSAAALPSLGEVSRQGVVFSRELYDAPAVEAGAPPHRTQTLSVPGLAQVEAARRAAAAGTPSRATDEPWVIPLEQDA